MKASVTETSVTERVLDIEISQDDIKNSFDGKIDKYRKKIQLPGFRSGKVPKKVVLARYGDAIRAESVEELMDQTVREELQNAKIEPVAPGQIEDFKDDKEAPITFKLKVEVDPEIEISGYEDLGVKAPEIVVPDEDIDSEIETLRRRVAKETLVEAPAENGNVVEGEYLSISIDGESNDINEENKNFRVELGASDAPEFDQALVGLSANDEKTVEITFPEDFENEQLKGKKAEYTVKVTAVKFVELPEVDDELAKQAGSDDLAALRENISKSIHDFRLDNEKRAVQDEAMDKLIEANPIEVPAARIRTFTERTLNKEEVTDEEVEANREQAEKEIRRHRILDFIATKEGLKAKQDDVDKRIMQISAMYGMAFQELKDNLRQSGRIVGIREELRLEKAMDFIIGIRPEKAE